jgi:protein tyrosine phosphatase type IVA
VSNEKRIGVHCVAGLGRAPLLVALALVNKGCPPINTIDLIRKNRKGALNVIQANYILEYKPAKSKKTTGCACNIF